MTQSADNPAAPALESLRELPKLAALDIVHRLMHASQERNDMLSGLRRSHHKYGDAVLTRLPAMKMVNLFGPDANRFVLLDQQRIFSAVCLASRSDWPPPRLRVLPGWHSWCLRAGLERSR